MSLHSRRRRTGLAGLAAALAVLALGAPAALAQSTDLRSQAPTSSLAGTHAKTPSDVEAALAQGAYYSSYGDPAPLPAPAPVAPAGAGDGIATLPFVLSLAGALGVGILAATGAQVLIARRRQPGLS